MNNILECQGLSKRYKKRGEPALDGVDLALPPGQVVGLLGPNGSGKTTLIKLACGLLQPSAGAVLIDGRRPGPATKAQVSYLPEREILPTFMRASALLDYYADFYADFDRAKAAEMLQRLGIASGMRLKHMSKGTREKVQLILAMSRSARLYLLDEPIGGVDPAARDFILDTIITNYSESATVVISTHLIADIEKVLDRVVFINRGRITLQAGVDEIREGQNKSVDALFREVFRC